MAVHQRLVALLQSIHRLAYRKTATSKENEKEGQTYLYTPKIILTTKQISQVITAVANLENKNRRPINPLPAKTQTQTETRSTQYELKELFLGDYRKLRPRSSEQARARIENFRRMRRDRLSKGRSGRAPHKSQNGDRPGGVLLSNPRSEPPYSELRTKQQYPDMTQPEPSNHAIDNNGLLAESTTYSWVREKMRSITDRSLTSSACSDMRSLLSGSSLRDSIMSDMSAATITGIYISTPVFFNSSDPTADENTKLIMLCCSSPKDCIHKKYNRTAGSQTLPTGEVCDGLSPKDFTMRYGRDIWNRSAFHLAAKWASDELVIPLLTHFISQKPRQPEGPDILNVKNVDGETFMHVLVRRWRVVVFHGHGGVASFCSLVVAEGFDSSLRNRLGRTFIRCLIDQMQYWGDSEAKSTLESFGCTLGILLSSAGLPPTLSNYVHGKLRNTDCENHYFGMQYYQVVYQNMCLSPENPSQDGGIGINAYDINGRTYLMALITTLGDATSNGSDVAVLEKIKSCISQKPDLNLLDPNGNTALHYATRANRQEVIELLTNSSINVDARNLQGLSAEDVAKAGYNLIRPGNQGSGAAYARVQGVLVRLFDGGRGRKTSPSGADSSLASEKRSQWFRATPLRRPLMMTNGG
ncbi:ankyrin [Xylariaceae sp. AK1471]|nr:ankyrin [Xylariaceae sp. AK1471]